MVNIFQIQKKKKLMVILFYRRNFKSMTSWRLLNLNAAEIWHSKYRWARALIIGKYENIIQITQQRICKPVGSQLRRRNRRYNIWSWLVRFEANGPWIQENLFNPRIKGLKLSHLNPQKKFCSRKGNLILIRVFCTCFFSFWQKIFWYKFYTTFNFVKLLVSGSAGIASFALAFSPPRVFKPPFTASLFRFEFTGLGR